MSTWLCRILYTEIFVIYVELYWAALCLLYIRKVCYGHQLHSQELVTFWKRKFYWAWRWRWRRKFAYIPNFLFHLSLSLTTGYYPTISLLCWFEGHQDIWPSQNTFWIYIFYGFFRNVVLKLTTWCQWKGNKYIYCFIYCFIY